MADRWTKALCRRLGVTEAGLRVLAKADAGQPIQGSGANHGAAGARPKLAADGMLAATPTTFGFPEYSITDKGREVVRKARAAGW